MTNLIEPDTKAAATSEAKGDVEVLDVDAGYLVGIVWDMPIGRSSDQCVLSTSQLAM
jgi:hypothetical protein